MQATFAVRSGRCSDEPLQATSEAGQPLESSRLERFDGEERDQPHHRAHLQRRVLAVGHVQHVVEEPVVIVPETDAVAAVVAHRVRDVQEVLPELARHVLVGRSWSDSSIAMASMLRQYIAIQLVPSD